MARLQMLTHTITTVLMVTFFTFAQGGNPNDDCKNFLDMLNKKLERVKEVVVKSNNPEALKALEEATALKDEAVKLLAENKPVEAKEKAKEALKLLSKALSLANGKNGDKGADNFIKNVGEKIAKSETIINNSKNDEAIKLLAEAKVKYEKALELQKAGKNKEAMQEAQAAFKLLSQALKLIHKGKGQQDDKAIEMMEKMAVEKLAEAKIAIEANPTGTKIEEAKKVYIEAETSLKTGQDLKAAGKTAEAIAEFRTSKRLSMQAYMLAKSK